MNPVKVKGCSRIPTEIRPEVKEKQFHSQEQMNNPEKNSDQGRKQEKLWPKPKKTPIPKQKRGKTNRLK